MITGIFGACFASIVCKIFKIENPVAQGLAIGTSAHALGTSRALEIGEVQGAMSSLAIAIAGIMTVVLAPIVLGIIS
jgi:putative effector of murein hydrolase